MGKVGTNGGDIALEVDGEKVRGVLSKVKEKGATQGRNKSGRKWKHLKGRASALVFKSQPILGGGSWAAKEKRRAAKKRMKEYERELKEAALERKRQAKQARRERKLRRAESALKNSTYQVISKTDTIKKMNKKQLRSLKKMQVDPKTGEIQFVNPYTGLVDDDSAKKKKRKKRRGR